MPLPSQTFGALRDLVLQYAGDPITQPPAARLWAIAEAEVNIREGYEKFCARTECLWDVAYLDEYAPVGNYSVDFEQVYFAAGEVFYSRSRINAAWESGYCGSVSAAGVESRVTSWWERDYFDVTAPNSALAETPRSMAGLERVTYDGLRVDALAQPELARFDPRYQLSRGWFSAYTLEGDGLRSLRKYQIPGRASQYPQWLRGQDRGAMVSGDFDGVDTSVAVAVNYVHLDEFARVISGVLMGTISNFGPFHVDSVQVTSTQADGFTAISAFAGYVVPSPRGVLRQFPGFHSSGGVMRGIAKRLSLDNGNTKIEFVRRPRKLQFYGDVLEIPDHWTRYIMYYALSRLFLRDGPGQDLSLYKHYTDRFEEGVSRVKSWMNRVQKSRVRRMGGAVPGGNAGNPRAVLPWNFGRPTR